MLCGSDCASHNFSQPTSLTQMVSVHGYNNEKKGGGFSDLYLMAGAFGIFVGVMLIGGGIGVEFLIRLAIEYWIWVVVGIGVVVICAKFLARRRKVA